MSSDRDQPASHLTTASAGHTGKNGDQSARHAAQVPNAAKPPTATKALPSHSEKASSHAQQPTSPKHSSSGAAAAATQDRLSPQAKDDLAQTQPEKAAPASVTTSSHTPIKLIRQYELVDLVKKYDPRADERLLNKAYVFAMKAHGGQTRKSGDPYFSHPLAVAAILTELRADPASVAAALLHDVVEDTDTSIEDIGKVFGPEITMLVDGVTKLSQIELKSEASKQAENFRKLVMATAQDVRVLLIKLADRLHNMRTLHFHDKEESKQRIALETLEIYAPLAGRIGVQKFREELEDLAFSVLNAEACSSIQERLDKLQSTVVEDVLSLAVTLRDRLSAAGLKAEVFSREKRPYSIFRKMSKKHVSFDNLADIYAFRILVPTIADCYRALGVIHTGWRMINEEFDDYISAPKPNGYQSIHTALLGPPRGDGVRQLIEVQIRTFEMHDAAERGVAAHWQYKDAVSSAEIASVEHRPPAQFDPYDTPRKLVDMFKMGDDPNEALAYAKLELFQDQVFVFTPKGRVIALPKGATALDFAYAVHTDVGDSCVGVKINNVERHLRMPLANGDIVRIMRSEGALPPAGWENFVMTGRARAAIRKKLKRLHFEEQVQLGRKLSDSVFAGAKLPFTVKAVRSALERLGEKTVDDVLAKVGAGEISVSTLVDAVYPGAQYDIESEVTASVSGEFLPRRAIDGLTPGVDVTMGACCTPIPGERIVGLKDDHGDIEVHTIYCEVLARSDLADDAWLDLKWRSDQEGLTAFTKISVDIRNEIGVFSDIAGIIARYGVSISNIHLERGARDLVTLVVEIEVRDARQLAQMLAGLRASASVISAERNKA